MKLVVERTGLGEDKARAAVDTVVDFLKQHAPAGLSAQIDSRRGWWRFDRTTSGALVGADLGAEQFTLEQSVE